MSRWEQGLSEPSTDNLVSIGKLFGVSVDSLMNEDMQLQTESPVLPDDREEKRTIAKRGKYSILKIVGIVLLALVATLVVCTGLVKDKRAPVPMEDINKGEVDVSEAVTLLLN